MEDSQVWAVPNMIAGEVEVARILFPVALSQALARLKAAEQGGPTAGAPLAAWDVEYYAACPNPFGCLSAFLAPAFCAGRSLWPA